MVGRVNIFRIAGKCGPAERTFAVAEKRTDKFRYKTLKAERIFAATLAGKFTQVVSVIEGNTAPFLHFEHIADMPCHAFQRTVFVFFGICFSQF